MTMRLSDAFEGHLLRGLTAWMAKRTEIGEEKQQRGSKASVVHLRLETPLAKGSSVWVIRHEDRNLLCLSPSTSTSP
jgi:hypothetical protein